MPLSPKWIQRDYPIGYKPSWNLLVPQMYRTLGPGNTAYGESRHMSSAPPASPVPRQVNRTEATGVRPEPGVRQIHEHHSRLLARRASTVGSVRPAESVEPRLILEGKAKCYVNVMPAHDFPSSSPALTLRNPPSPVMDVLIRGRTRSLTQVKGYGSTGGQNRKARASEGRLDSRGESPFCRSSALAAPVVPRTSSPKPDAPHGIWGTR